VVWDVDIREFGPENEFLCLIIFRLHCLSGTENERENDLWEAKEKVGVWLLASLAWTWFDFWLR
jgi:hypothetical protein